VTGRLRQQWLLVNGIIGDWSDPVVSGVLPDTTDFEDQQTLTGNRPCQMRIDDDKAMV
jgi:hypothetical protein